MPPPRTAARYVSPDAETMHDIVVLRTDAGRWRVLDVDVDADTVVHVETLLGYDDRLSQATALALDYAHQMQLFLDGVRLEHPLPSKRPDPPAEPACVA
ncbi:MAG TPA: hypothetical protein VI300_00020 [Solirubrobacter sp.]